MGQSKNSFIRYKILDKCLADTTRRYYWPDLLEKVNTTLINMGFEGVSIRTINGDIPYMESEEGFNAPIQRVNDGRKVYLKYSNPDFSILNAPISSGELSRLRNALQVLDRFEGEQGFEWIPATRSIISDQLITNNERKVISFQTNNDYKGANFITPLFNAIVNRKALKIVYKTFDSNVFDFVFHPNYLKQYNNRWFVFGINDSAENVPWNIPLDRIQSTEEIQEIYKDLDIDWDDYFYDFIGVTNTLAESVKVKMVVSQKQKKYILTKPIHPSQRNRELENGSLEIRISVKLNYELESLILSLGEEVEVLEPKELRDSISARIAKANERYV